MERSPRTRSGSLLQAVDFAVDSMQRYEQGRAGVGAALFVLKGWQIDE